MPRELRKRREPTREISEAVSHLPVPCQEWLADQVLRYAFERRCRLSDDTNGESNSSDDGSDFLRRAWQVLSTKVSLHDTLILLRYGDVYECFFEDAGIAADVLNLTFVSKPGLVGDRIECARFPAEFADHAVKVLRQAGHSIAVLEEVADATELKPGEMMRRAVVRIYKPLAPQMIEDSSEETAQVSSRVRRRRCLALTL